MRLLGIVIFSLALAALPASAAEKGKAPTDGPVFMTLPAMHIPVFEGDAVTRQASVVVALELEQGRDESDVAPLKAKLVDAFLSDLTLLVEQRAHTDRLIDAAAIKPKLLETTQRILGPGYVKDVLIQGAMERARRR